MLTLRVWIITALIVLSTMGAYLWWARRARVTYTSRSLSAANTANKPQTRLLHVEGCHDDFTVKVGELVEPRVVPGASLERFKAIYGDQTVDAHPAKNADWMWDQNAYILTVRPAIEQNPPSVHIALKQGHVVQTLDGIELGIDSFGTVLRKMRDRGVETHERIEHTGDNWTLIVSFYSSCSRNYRSEYTRTLPTTQELEKQIPPLPPTPGQPTPNLYRSDVYMNKVVSEYTLIPSNGKDEPQNGFPASHL